MPGSKVLVFGGTGPAGICLLRELLFRGHATILFARNPTKVPEDLRFNPQLEVGCSVGCRFEVFELDTKASYRWSEES